MRASILLVASCLALFAGEAFAQYGNPYGGANYGCRGGVCHEGGGYDAGYGGGRYGAGYGAGYGPGYGAGIAPGGCVDPYGCAPQPRVCRPPVAPICRSPICDPVPCPHVGYRPIYPVAPIAPPCIVPPPAFYPPVAVPVYPPVAFPPPGYGWAR